ncbi:outer membrane protein assembly factor BamB family protein [Streptomyces sp. TP-A0874]|uniref:outer membrane protein assembly factor BamB family protein n=1 Tax=Streptomyces sp. TP-A0874 TaxID=549819 RepID=UPI0008532984|nr:PQQ-binding-like beta-propeller repeat protein [Streptomyces sp. TP-A0874]
MERLGAADPGQVGPYALLGRLGDDETGSVYAGRSPTGATVAIEMVRADLAGEPGFRGRFSAAATAGRAAAGAHLAPVVDADPDGPAPWVATALPPGLTLDQAVSAHGALPEPTLRRLAQGIAEALAVLHAAGSAHGALRPANVLLARERPYLVGWVTPREGAPADDMASLGAALVFAASGREPSGPVPGDEDVAALPPSLRDAIGSCLAADPQARPAARELLDQLDRPDTPLPAGGWLPPPLADEVAEASGRGGTAPTTVPPRPNHPPAPPSTAAGGAGISRRKMLIGAAGGAVALGGITAAVIALSGGSSSPGPVSAPSSSSGGSPVPSGPPPASSSPSPSEPPRITLSAEDATPAWSVTVDAVPTEVVASDEVLALFSEKSTTFLDSAGKPVFRPLKVHAGSSSGLYRGMAFADAEFYIVGLTREGEQSLGAVDSATGKTKWVVSLEGRGLHVPAYVAVGGDSVYVCGTYFLASESMESRTGYIWAFDTATGRERWRLKGADLTNVLVPPSGDYLLAGSAKMSEKSSHLRVIETGGRGTRGWKKSVPAARYDQVGQPLTSYADGLFVFGREKILAVDRATGEEKWHLAAEEQPDVRFGTPVPSTDGKTVYIPVGQDLVALDAADGGVKWMAVLPEHVLFEASLGLSLNGPGAWCSADTVFATDTTKTLWAVDAATGEARWKYTDPGQPDTGFKWCVGGDRVWISSNLTVTAIAAHG